MSSDQGTSIPAQTVPTGAPLKPLSSNPVNPPPPENTVTASSQAQPDVTAPSAEPVGITTPTTEPPKGSSSTPGLEPLLQPFIEALPIILRDADYDEMWGITLQPSVSHIPTVIVLQKFLRANPGNFESAKRQLTEALKWRKEMNPQKLADEMHHDRSKFGGLGYVTVYEMAGKKEVVTWNIYGAVKDIKSTFGDVQQ